MEMRSGFLLSVTAMLVVCLMTTVEAGAVQGAVRNTNHSAYRSLLVHARSLLAR